MTQGKLVLMRHGETADNKERIMTGQRDVPLAEKGEHQAREAGVLIASIRFDKVYSSHLSRAFNTAALALEAAGTQGHLQNNNGTWQIEKRMDIAEIHSGEFTGHPLADPRIAAWKLIYDVPVPGGESPKQVAERVQKFVDAEVIPLMKAGKNVMIVAHAAVFQAFEIALGVKPRPADGEEIKMGKIPNAAPIVYEFQNGRLKDSYQL